MMPTTTPNRLPYRTGRARRCMSELSEVPDIWQLAIVPVLSTPGVSRTGPFLRGHTSARYDSRSGGRAIHRRSKERAGPPTGTRPVAAPLRLRSSRPHACWRTLIASCPQKKFHGLTPSRLRCQGNRTAGVNTRHLPHFFPFPTMATTRKNKDVSGPKPEVPAAKAVVNATQEAKRLPVRSLREGDCSASIWVRELTVRGDHRVYFSVTLERSFKDPSGQFRYTKTFDPDSLPKVALLCQKAQEAIDELQQAR